MSIGMVYLLSPLIDILSGRVTGARAYGGAASLVAFVVVYVSAVLSAEDMGEPGRWTYPLLILTALMATTFPLIFGGNWLSLPIYVTVVISMSLPTRTALPGLVGMALVVLGDGLATGTDGGTIVFLLLQVVTLGMLFMSVRNTRALVNRLNRAQGEVARLAAGEERLRIARDLDNARAALEAAGVAVTVRTAGTPLPDALDGLFGWAVREGITNVVRHAAADRCEITVAHGEDAATLEIADDGRPAGTYQAGSGLTGLTERVRASGGSVEAGPRDTGGFRLRVLVPVAVKSRV